MNGLIIKDRRRDDMKRILLAISIFLVFTWGSCRSTTFTLNFDGNGATGGVMASVLFEEGKEENLPSNVFTKADHSFVAWNTVADASGTSYPDGASISLTSSLTLYAIWQEDSTNPDPPVETFRVSYNTNGGVEIPPVDVEKDSKVERPEGPINDKASEFLGWFKDANFATPWVFDVDLVTEDLTLYANWKYTITFNGNGGSLPLAEQTYQQIFTHNEFPFLDANLFTNTEKGFIGWSEVEGGSLTYTDRAKIAFNENMILYASWSASSYTITYRGNNGSVPNSGDPLLTEYTQNVPEGSTVRLIINNFTNGEQGFAGWNTKEIPTEHEPGESFLNGAEITPAGDMTLYAQWADSAVIVFFKNDGGEESKTQTIAKETETQLDANTFEWDSHRFEGWAESETGDVLYVDKGLVTLAGSINLYAKWTQFHTITFNGNNPTTGEMESITIDNGVVTNLPANLFSKDGHNFAGWTITRNADEVAYANEAEITGTASFELFAKWEPIVYTITYNGSDAAEANYTQKFEHDARVSLIPNAFTKADHTFIGWSETEGGTTVNYNEGAAVDFNEDKPLYAIWESTANTWTITFMGSGGSVPNTLPPMESYTQAVVKNSSANLVINNFVFGESAFSGWTVTENGTTAEYANGDSITPADNITLYAVWADAALVTFYANYEGDNGISLTQIMLKNKSTPLDRNKFSRHQYYFEGWNINPTGGGDFYADEEFVELADDIDLYAQWVQAPYSDSNGKFIYSNGQNLKLTKGATGSTVTWIEKNITLAEISSAYIADDSDLSEYVIVGAGNHLLEGGAIKGIKEMSSVTISGELAIGSEAITLTSGSQLQVGELTGADDSIRIKTYNNFDGTKIATLVSGTAFDTVKEKLYLLNKEGNLNLQIKAVEDDIQINGSLGLSPDDQVEWRDDNSFKVPTVVLGKPGTIFSLSVEDGYFMLPESNSIGYADFNMAIPVVDDGSGLKPSGYVEASEGLKTDGKYSYVQFFPSTITDSFPAANAENFVKQAVFYPFDVTKGMSVKINLETLALTEGGSEPIINTSGTDFTKPTYFNGSFYKVVSQEGGVTIQWNNAYDEAKTQSFNGLKGYLMTITSSSENDFIYDKAGGVGKNSWIGSTRLPSENGYDSDLWGTVNTSNLVTKWNWVCGPEAGKSFFPVAEHPGKDYIMPDGEVDFSYNNWGLFGWGNEPNADSYSPGGITFVETCAHYFSSGGHEKKWNDVPHLPQEDTIVANYFLEFTPYEGGYKEGEVHAKPLNVKQIYKKP